MTTMTTSAEQSAAGRDIPQDCPTTHAAREPEASTHAPCDSLGLPRPVDEDWQRVQERIDRIVHHRDETAAGEAAVRKAPTSRRISKLPSGSRR